MYLNLLILTTFVTANIVNLDFRLAERALLNKYRFSFSDFDSKKNLKDAMVKFDLEVRPSHTLPNVTYALFIIESDEETSEEVEAKILAEES